MKGPGTNIHELTRVEAYLLSEKAGHPSHMHDYFWTQAEAIVRQRAAIVDVAVKASRNPSTKIGKSAKTKPKPATSKAKKMPEAQLSLGDEPSPARSEAAAPKPKTTSPAKKKSVIAPAKPESKPASKSK